MLIDTFKKENEKYLLNETFSLMDAFVNQKNENGTAVKYVIHKWIGSNGNEGGWKGEGIMILETDGRSDKVG